MIAYRAGSVPEVIEDGVTGFIVSDEQDAVRALRMLPRLDRRRIRARFEERFTALRMAGEYVRQYRSLVEPQGSDGRPWNPHDGTGPFGV
jgi:glycosyltransferase involved in cell wall biosynthesis